MSLARKLRKNQTPAEEKMWGLLRSRQLNGYKFRRQFTIDRYVVDFACFQHRLVIEIDGGQHADNPNDIMRTKELESNGWHVMRFWNNGVLENADGVLSKIVSELEMS